MILQALREIWEVQSEIADAWALIAEQINTELEALGAADLLDPPETLGAALEQITVADLLNLYSKGFVVGANAGLYEVVGTGEFDQAERVGTIYVTPRAMPEERPAGKSTYGAPTETAGVGSSAT
jgi:hypothetical protein